MTLTERIEKALEDFTKGRASMHVPPLDTDVDVVLAECSDRLSELEAICAALAAEMAWMKKFCKDAAFDADYEAELGMERGGFTDALNNIKTPATDAFLAEVRAQGVEMFAIEWGGHDSPYGQDAYNFAEQIRKGVQS